MYLFLFIVLILVAILIGASFRKQVMDKKAEERLNRRLNFIAENPRLWKILNMKLIKGEISEEEYNQIIKMIEHNEFI